MEENFSIMRTGFYKSKTIFKCCYESLTNWLAARSSILYMILLYNLNIHSQQLFGTLDLANIELNLQAKIILQ